MIVILEKLKSKLFFSNYFLLWGVLNVRIWIQKLLIQEWLKKEQLLEEGENVKDADIDFQHLKELELLSSL